MDDLKLMNFLLPVTSLAYSEDACTSLGDCCLLLPWLQ